MKKIAFSVFLGISIISGMFFLYLEYEFIHRINPSTIYKGGREYHIEEKEVGEDDAFYLKDDKDKTLFTLYAPSEDNPITLLYDINGDGKDDIYFESLMKQAYLNYDETYKEWQCTNVDEFPVGFQVKNNWLFYELRHPSASFSDLCGSTRAKAIYSMLAAGLAAFVLRKMK